jgi:hypothetical protein
MNQPPPLPGASSAQPLSSPRSYWGRKLLITAAILFGITGIAAASAAWWYNYNFHASPFQAVQLSTTEQSALDHKMDALKGNANGAAPATDPSKTITLSEREINGYLKEQGLGEQVKVKIDDGRINATALIPVDKDVPLLGGHTVRLSLAVNTALDKDHRLLLSVADVNVSGISLPNAWLGGIKGLNLLADDAKDSPIKNLADGIKSFDVKNGEVRVVLNE